MGGSHISALKLIRALDRKKYRPLIVLHDDRGQFADFLRAEGVAFEHAPTPWHLAPASRAETIGKMMGAPKALASLARYLQQRDVRIVHTNEGPMHVTWGPAARLAGRKLLWHHRSSPRAKGLRFLAPLLAHRVASVSRFAAPRPGVFSAAGRCTVVHSPFDTDAPKADRVVSRTDAIKELGIAAETPILGYFGNMVTRKRPLLFVETIAAINRRRPNNPAIGLLFGSPLEDGLYQAVIARAAELGVSDHIRMMGFRHPSEPWMAACDALLVTAVNEPFGRTLIEAMLLETPVIAANSGGNPEAIEDGENGLIVPPDDPESFAEAALALIDDPARAKRIAVTAHEQALSRFGVERHCAQISAIYDQLLADAA